MANLFFNRYLTMWTTSRSYWTLAIILLLTIFCLFQLPKIAYDYDLNKLFPKNDPQTDFFNDFQKEFENDNDYILIGLPVETSIFNSDYLASVAQLTETLDTLEYVTQVHSVTNAKFRKRLSFSSKIFESPIIHINSPDRYAKDSADIYQDEFMTNYLVAEDAKSSLLYIKHEEDLDEPACRALSESINQSVQNLKFSSYHIAGKCHGQTYFVDLVQQEMTKFIIGSVVLIIGFLFLFYQNIWGVFLPLLITGLSVLWTVGWMAWLGKPLDIISNILPTFLLIIGISHVVHFITYYIQQLDTGLEKTKALDISIKEVGLATFLTTLTTAIGFITLATSSFASLIDLGKYAVVGLAFSFILTYTLLPCLLTLLPISIGKKRIQNGFLHKPISKAFIWVNTHTRFVLLASLGIFLVSLLGTSLLKTNNYILDGVKDDNPQKQSFDFFESHYGGARSFELVLTLRDDSKSIFDLDVLKEIENIEAYLTSQYGVNNIISPAQIIKGANKVYNKGKSSFFKLPSNQERITTIVNGLEKSDDALPFHNFIIPSHKKARLSGKMADIGSHAAKAKNKSLDEFLNDTHNIKLLSTRLTGTPHLIDLNMTYLSKNVMYGLLIAILIIGFMFGLMAKSFKLAILILIPNILPLLFIAGIMGFFNIALNLSTSIIFIISFSIAVDDSIHFLSRFRSYVKDYDVPTAIEMTYRTTGEAIAVTSLVLAAGFFVLCISDFLGTFYFGLLVGLTLLAAMIADLTLLPVLLKKYYRK